MQYVILTIVLVVLAIYLKSPEVKGRRSEQAVARKLEFKSFWKYGGKTLTNVYIPKKSGGTTEIDVLYITSKGLFVLENKNYAGYIFGSESNNNWTVTLYAGKTSYGGKKLEKYKFYNPIWQNRSHIKHLKSFLNSDIKTFSFITFSDRGSLKDITVDSTDVYVCNHSKLSRVLNEVWESNPDVLNDKQVYKIYNKLEPLTKVDKVAIQKHIGNIRDKLSNADLCPLCGGKLVLRTAKKGSNVGNQFYGCSNFPKCRYTRSA